MSYVRHIKRPANIVRSFGLKRGTIAYSSYVRDHLIRSNRWTPKQLAIHGASYPVWLRPGTSDWLVMEETFIEGEYDFSGWPEHHQALQACYQRCVARSQTPVIVDCGANIGLSAIWFAENFPAAQIYAIEPEAENFAILVKNASAYPNIVPIKAGVSDRSGRFSLENPEGAPWAWRTREANDGDIEMITIPALLKRQENTVLMIVKINIEGAESGLFQSNTDWIKNAPLIIIEIHDWLIPWCGAGHAVFTNLVHDKRDYLMRGRMMFTFSHSCRERLSVGETADPTALRGNL